MARERSSDPGKAERVQEAERRVASQRLVVQQRWRELVLALELLEEHERALGYLKVGSTTNPRRSGSDPADIS
jgi:hypothetical protein